MSGLPVPAGNDRRVGALGVGQREESLGLVDGDAAGSRGDDEVGSQVRAVGSADALDPDLRGAVAALEGISDDWARADSLFMRSEFKTSTTVYDIAMRMAYHVAGLGRSSGKDVDDLGAGRAAARLKLIARGT